MHTRPENTPPETPCPSCKQARPLFPYKPIHDCIAEAGLVRLDEAADLLAGIEDRDDRWCQARIDHIPIRRCDQCAAGEAAAEEKHIRDHDLTAE